MFAQSKWLFTEKLWDWADFDLIHHENVDSWQAWDAKHGKYSYVWVFNTSQFHYQGD